MAISVAHGLVETPLGGTDHQPDEPASDKHCDNERANGSHQAGDHRTGGNHVNDGHHSPNGKHASDKHASPPRYDPGFTDRVIAATGPKANARLAQIMPSLLRHLHDFAREVDLTVAEWMLGVELVRPSPSDVCLPVYVLTTKFAGSPDQRVRQDVDGPPQRDAASVRRPRPRVPRGRDNVQAAIVGGVDALGGAGPVLPGRRAADAQRGAASCATSHRWWRGTARH